MLARLTKKQQRKKNSVFDNKQNKYNPLCLHEPQHLNKTEQIAHNVGRSSCIAIQNMLMGYISTPHPATGYSPYEALMRRNIKTKQDYKAPSGTTAIQKMETQITRRDIEYKKKWDNHHRHPICRKSNFKVGEKVLLKRKKINKWSAAHEREYYMIVGCKWISNQG